MAESVIKQYQGREMINNPAVLFITQPNLHYECLKYRIFNAQEYLKLNEIFSEVIFARSLDSRIIFNGILQSDFNIIVFYRTLWTPQIARFIEAAKKYGKIIIYDIDDYLFNEEIIAQIDYIQSQLVNRRHKLAKQIQLYKKCLQLCDYFTGATSFLTNAAEKIGKKSFTVKNGINQKEIKLTEKILKNKKFGKSKIVISYLSGSTHRQRDFVIVLDTLEKILIKYPNVELKIIGLLEIPNFFEKKFQKRIVKLGYMKWEKVYWHLLDVDINIYPLKINTFSRGKSELKYFQTALLKIPSVVSSVDSFQQAIKNGWNGFLAAKSKDWEKYLEKLIISPFLRKEMGEVAYQHARKSYYTSMPSNVLMVYNKIIQNYYTSHKMEDIKLCHPVSRFGFAFTFIFSRNIYYQAYLLKNCIKKNFIRKLPFSWQKKIYYLWVLHSKF